MTRPTTKILVDCGDPHETRRVKEWSGLSMDRRPIRELTRNGAEKFAANYRATLSRPA